MGTAIALLVRKPKHKSPAVVRFRDLWGQAKREELVASLERFSPQLYDKLTPARPLGLPFRPLGTEQDYLTWPTLADIFVTTFPGVFTARDCLVVDIDENQLRKRMLAFFDVEVSHEEMRAICPQAMEKANRYEPIPTREQLRKRGFLPDKILRYVYRPFDLRWLYWEPETKLLNEKRTEYVGNVFEGNIWIAAAKQNRKDFDPPAVARRHAETSR